MLPVLGILYAKSAFLFHQRILWEFCIYLPYILSLNSDSTPRVTVVNRNQPVTPTSDADLYAVCHYCNNPHFWNTLNCVHIAEMPQNPSMVVHSTHTNEESWNYYFLSFLLFSLFYFSFSYVVHEHLNLFHCTCFQKRIKIKINGLIPDL